MFYIWNTTTMNHHLHVLEKFKLLSSICTEKRKEKRQSHRLPSFIFLHCIARLPASQIQVWPYCLGWFDDTRELELATSR